MSASNLTNHENSQLLIKGIEHIAIATPDPQQLAQWYVEHLNFSALLDTGSTVYIKSINSIVLEFVKAEAIPPKPHIRDAGLRHIAFAVDDLEMARAELEAAGIEFQPEPVVLPGMRLLFFRDPEGNHLHLVEREMTLLH
jgi:glyoxylase I family protein